MGICYERRIARINPLPHTVALFERVGTPVIAWHSNFFVVYFFYPIYLHFFEVNLLHA